jgi:hypothetical protein
MALLLDEHDSGSGASARRGVRPPGGPDLGVIRDARRRRRSRRMRVAVGAVLAVAAAGSAAALLHSGGSRGTVAAGSSLAQRVELLRHLTPVVRLPHA